MQVDSPGSLVVVACLAALQQPADLKDCIVVEEDMHPVLN